jgi:tetratricopeptide (TPR) repeat protein
MRPAIAGLAMALAGCGSHPVATAPPDETLDRLGHAGDIAYNLENPSQAAGQYRAALGRARERDDASAIADTGFNLATAELRAGKPAEAIRTVQGLQAELARRGIADAGFDLITATALFQLGNYAEADRLAATLAKGPVPLADSAWFLRGLAADARNDGTGVRRAAAALSPAANAGDKAELQARIAHDPAMALHAADLRRAALDYRGMARSLALAAQFSPDPAQSASLYLRAGQSAAAQRDVAQARIWLAKARSGGSGLLLRAEADRALAGLAAK